MSYERAVAKKVWVKTLLEGEYHPSPGEYEPSFLDVGHKISRCNVIGMIDSVDKNYLKDETGKIKVMAFDGELDSVKEGDLVRVIGKIKERENERFISVEIAKVLNNPKYLELRKKELGEFKPFENVQEGNVQKKKKEDLDIEEIDI